MADLRINDHLTIPEREISVHFARAGGPGGQHVNKVETKVELRFMPGRSAALSPAQRALILQRLAPQLTTQGELIVVSDRTRNQSRNRQDALDKLAALLRAGLQRPKPRRATRPTAGSVRRRLESKRARSKLKQSRRDHPNE